MLYAIVAEFTLPQQIVDAAVRTREEGYREVDAYTPFPIEEVCEALGCERSRLPILVFFGGLFGGLAGYFLQYWSSAHDYLLNIGGRPPHSWPMFIPIAFETTILGAALTAVLGMFILNKLPMPYHPVFNWKRFALASSDRYFLAIKASDPRFDRESTRDFLLSLGAHEVADVEA